ncbi:hypothetical protein ARMGADRAFT_1089107 [Armillaria gallica]|uniref:Alpha-type protein kinase domain-containing protein n=1 Tax=Armillaria gallica TaxID=47427 RepID=A0A2H3D5R7_ARMGA|nr:hypothetical protein ARMGADRAFT_1089107 [Armillaria gallica]
MSQQCLCFGPVSVAKLSGVPQRIGTNFTIFIQGVAPRTLPLRVDGSFTIQDILNIVKIHISQAECTLAAPFNCYLGGRWRPLLAEETLDSLNVQDLSHFYIRYVLPGDAVQIIVNTCIVQNVQRQENPTSSSLSRCGWSCYFTQTSDADTDVDHLRHLCGSRCSEKELSKSVDQRASSSTTRASPTVASVSRAELQKVLEAKNKAEATADVLLKLFQQNLTSSGNVFPVPDVATIDRSIKNAKAKGARPEARLPVAISSRLKKDSLKTGYSIAHIRHESQSGESARVFVQVKRENGTKKGLSFWNIQRGVKFPAATSQINVTNLVIESLLVIIHDHLKVQGFSFVAGDFFLVDSGWSPILDGDPDEPTELFYKGLATSSKKKGIAGIKFVQPAQENWFMVIKPAIADKYDLWAAGGEVTPTSTPVKRAIRKKKGNPIPMQSIGASEVSERDVHYNSTILGDNSLFFDSDISMASGPPSSMSSKYSQPSLKLTSSSKRSLSPPNVEERQKRVHPDITPSVCERWFNAIPDLIKKGGTYIEGQAQPGKSIHSKSCRYLYTFRPNFAFASQTRGHIYVDWAESPEKRLGSGSFKTAHLGVLQVGITLQGVPLPPALQGNICIKHPYQGATQSRDPRRSPKGYERTCILQEANTMFWANALHDMSLNMVLSKATSLGEAPGPIPDLRFVEAAVVMKSRPDSVRPKDWLGFCALVERLLSTDDFVKYVCNGTPQLIDLDSNEKHHAAVFLCFLQHVQYHFTKGKAFVSDYQGAGCWLTDPQVMAKSEVAGH